MTQPPTHLTLPPAAGALRRLAAGETLLRNAVPGFTGYADRLAELRNRLEAGRFHLAVLGQFKRGKSSLVNALIGREVLPTSVVPLTAIPTLLAYGESLEIHIHFQEKTRPVQVLRPETAPAETLGRYVSEAGNPENRLGIDHVKVFHPAPLLRSGLILIDTPGIGSTFRHNTETTLGFLAECDAAMFVLSPDPPITETEIEFLKQVRTHVVRLFFILNKADLFTPAELAAAREFLERTLRRQIGIDREPLEILTVSARNALAAAREENPNAPPETEIAALRARLEDFAATEKSAAGLAAVRKKAARILEEAHLQAAIRFRSLQMPIHELEDKETRLQKILNNANTLTYVLEDRLKGERTRIIAQIEVRCGEVRTRTTQALETQLQAAYDQSQSRPRLDALRDQLGQAVPTLFGREFRDALEWFKNSTENTLQPYIEEIRELITSVSRETAALFDLPVQPHPPSLNLELPPEPSWTTEIWSATINPLSFVHWDFLLPAFLRRRRNQRRLKDEIRELVTLNLEKMRWALLQTLNDTTVRFLADVRDRLGVTRAAVLDSMTAARALRQKTAGDLHEEIDRSRRFEQTLAGLITETGSTPQAGPNLPT